MLAAPGPVYRAYNPLGAVEHRLPAGGHFG